MKTKKVIEEQIRQLEDELMILSLSRNIFCSYGKEMKKLDTQIKTLSWVLEKK